MTQELLELLQKPVLKVADVARLLGVNPKTVRKAIQNGTFRNVGHGRCVRVPSKQVAELLYGLAASRPASPDPEPTEGE